MVLVFLAFAALVILGAAMVLTGRADPGISPPDRPAAPTLPSGPWRGDDVDGLRFRVGLRGYRMQDVDAALAALADELRRRDDQSVPRGQSLSARPEDPPGTAPAG